MSTRISVSRSFLRCDLWFFFSINSWHVIPLFALCCDFFFFFSSRRRHTRSLCDWSSDVCFFFSSRRRHTRSLCDWSSDVCSSDLSMLSSWPVGEYVEPLPFNEICCNGVI